MTTIVVCLLVALAALSFFSLNQMGKLRGQLKTIADVDVLAMESVTGAFEYQLRKQIIWQQIISISEEMGFEKVEFARLQYLNDQLAALEKSFSGHIQKVQEQTANVRRLLVLSARRNGADAHDIEDALEQITVIDAADKTYDASVMNLFKLIRTGNFQLSLENIEDIQHRQAQVTESVRDLLAQIQSMMRIAVSQARSMEQVFKRTLIICVAGVALIMLLSVFWLVKGISRRLERVANAAAAIGHGDLTVRLEEIPADEIGRTCQAFNSMAKQLQQAQESLKNSRDSLASHLELMNTQKKDLQKVNAQLDRFVQTVTHDIAGSLTMLVGYAAYLEKHSQSMLDEKGKESLAGIRKGADRMNALVRDLLQLTKISRIKNPYEQVAIQALAESAIDANQFLIKEAGIKVSIEGQWPTMVCDRIKTAEVFNGLISNAIKYSSKVPQGGQVVLSYNDAGGSHEFIFRDNGIGIDPKDQEVVFDMFRRLDAAKGYEGTGAGLAIVKSAVEDQGGSIRLESSLGNGTTFFVRFPKSQILR